MSSLGFGRQYGVAFKTVDSHDPFTFKFTSIIRASQASATAGTHFDNDIRYTGVSGPMTPRVEWALGEQAGSGTDNSPQAAGPSYANG
jgi:predicted porin